MGTTTLYPGGQSLSSTALAPADINKVMLDVTCGMLGIVPPDYSQVRDVWQTQGQPFQDVNRDVCYVACVPENVDYRLVRNMAYGGVAAVATQSWQYTRGWRVTWTFYGPNATDRARMAHSALFIDYFTDQLAAANLFPLPDPPEPVRVPEVINAQWFERADFHCIMYENVTETLNNVGAATSVEVKVYDGSPDDPVADITVQRS